MHVRLLAGLTLLTTAILLGCGGGNSNTAGNSAAGHAVEAGNLGVFPATLNFGKVTVGTKKGLTATLTAGNARIVVRSADWGGPGFSIAGVVFPLTVPAGQSVTFKVTFAPKSAGQVSGNVKFVSDADNSPKAIFNGNGTATPAHRVTLAWRSPASSVAGFHVYRGVSAQGPFTRLTSSLHPQATFTDASVVGGSTYFYSTTAVNRKGKESKRSNQVKVTIPNS